MFGPANLEEAKRYRYDSGYKYQPSYCAADRKFGNLQEYRGIISSQCTRKPGHGPDGIFCKQHARMWEVRDERRARMVKFRKLPVEIDAIQWFQHGDHPNVIHLPASHPAWNVLDQAERIGWIDTLEGGHVVHIGDWIIRGVNGEFYPCKPDIFKKTYERVEENTPEDLERAHEFLWYLKGLGQ